MSNGDGDKHRRNTANLRPPWKPGQSGNPAGRPKRKTFTELAHAYLSARVNPKDRSSPTRLELLCETVYDLAIQGDACAIKLIFDRIDPIPRSPRVAVANVVSGETILDRLRSGEAIIRPPTPESCTARHEPPPGVGRGLINLGTPERLP